MPSHPRVVAGRYEITSPIGRGGMGEVWAGYDKRLDRAVAVKLLRPAALTGEDRDVLAKRFARESRLTARVEHAGVPPVFDAGADGESLYLVMQLVAGVTLSDFLAERETLPLELAASIGAQLASVLAAAHTVPVVHRDLKPSNVMIRPDGTVVVLDFGVAALLGADLTRLTDTGEMLGSPAYISPEQVVGAVPSPRSDLYSLGCILHEMLAGERPFTGGNSWAVVLKHMQGEPPPLRALRPDIPERVERIVLDLLAKRPEDRPPDAPAVYEGLLPYLPAAGSAPSATSSATDPDPTRPYRHPLAPPPISARTPRRPAARPAGASRPTGPTEPAPDLDQQRDEAARLAEIGRFTQAAEMLADVLARAGLEQGEIRGVRLQLANTLLLGSDYARALPEYEALCADVSAERGDADTDVLAWRLQAATCRAALGEPGEALDELERVLAIRRAQLGDLASETVELRRQVALLRASSGQTGQAASELRELAAQLDDTDQRKAEIVQLLHRLEVPSTNRPTRS